MGIHFTDMLHDVLIFQMIYYRLRAASVLVCKGGTCKLSGFGFVQDITDRNLHETVSTAILHFLSF